MKISMSVYNIELNDCLWITLQVSSIVPLKCIENHDKTVLEQFVTRSQRLMKQGTTNFHFFVYVINTLHVYDAQHNV